jgi:hypothetical protein
MYSEEESYSYISKQRRGRDISAAVFTLISVRTRRSGMELSKLRLIFDQPRRDLDKITDF